MITLENGYRFEAEELALNGYRIESSSNVGASSGKFIGTRQSSGATGQANGTFTGDAGTYQVEVGYYDENDGKSPASVTVAGNKLQFTFDQNLGSSLPAASTHTTKVSHPSITLKNGDPFSLYGQANGAEYARFDYIDFIRTDATDSPGTDTSSGTGLEAFEAEVAKLVNAFRAQNGKKALTVDSKLNTAAEKHSDDMAFNDFFSHTGSDGSRVGARVSAAGYDWRSVGENIAAGQSTPQKVFDAWKASSGHRANMLGSWEDMGVGYEYLSSDTGKVNYHHYWTLDFALA
jgi:uncharacterized protein YkwD